MDKVFLVTKCFITNHEGNVLILKRSNNAKVRPGKWDLPGGMVEHEENPNIAVLRELEEETTISISNASIFHISTEQIPAYILSFFYTAKYLGGQIIISDEHSTFEWVGLSDFDGLDLPEKFKVAAKLLG